MHVIRINRLTLENFKCHASLTVALEGRNGSIYGDNAAGKTSVYDALTWLLFGKDSLGNSDAKVDIKPLDAAGNVRDHQAITSVEAELDVDGTTRVLRRSIREKWTTRRGSSEAVYDGNESDYAIDGVPMKKNAYDAQVKELLPEDVFRMLTAVDYLPAQLPWQKRRNVLFDMAGTMTDRQIMDRETRFQPLAEGMGNLDLQSYRAKLQAERKGFTGVRDETPARLSELQKTVEEIQGLDFQKVRQEIEDLSHKADEVKGEILAIDHDSAVDGLRMEIRSIDQDIRDLDARNSEYRREHDGSGRLLQLRKDLQNAQFLLRQKERDLNFTRGEARQAMERNKQTEIKIQFREDDLDKELQRLREQWVEVNDQTFTGGKCPTCGQDLPAAQLMEAKQRFSADQKGQLDFIQKKAAQVKRERENLRTMVRLEEVPAPETIQALEDACAEQKAQTEQAEKALQDAERTVEAPADMEGYQEQRRELERKREELNRKVTDLVAGTGDRRAQLQQKIRDIGYQIQEQNRILAREDLLLRSRQRMEQLKEEQRSAAAGMEAIDRMLFLMEEFTRYKAQFVEQGINSLFRLAKFRLFREQANGGLEERCDVTYNGVPYDGLNNGMRINVGIDIINALSRFYGVQVPLFIDNAESVTNLETCDSQTIRLVVSEKDKELRIV